jgi:hypothetical protein
MRTAQRRHEPILRAKLISSASVCGDGNNWHELLLENLPSRA